MLSLTFAGVGGATGDDRFLVPFSRAIFWILLCLSSLLVEALPFLYVPRCCGAINSRFSIPARTAAAMRRQRALFISARVCLSAPASPVAFCTFRAYHTTRHSAPPAACALYAASSSALTYHLHYTYTHHLPVFSLAATTPPFLPFLRACAGCLPPLPLPAACVLCCCTLYLPAFCPSAPQQQHHQHAAYGILYPSP